MTHANKSKALWDPLVRDNFSTCSATCLIETTSIDANQSSAMVPSSCLYSPYVPNSHKSENHERNAQGRWRFTVSASIPLTNNQGSVCEAYILVHLNNPTLMLWTATPTSSNRRVICLSLMYNQLVCRRTIGGYQPNLNCQCVSRQFHRFKKQQKIIHLPLLLEMRSLCANNIARCPLQL